MQDREEISAEVNNTTKIQVFAELDDLSGKKYYLKAAQGYYIWLDSDLERFEVVPEAAAYSAVIKHGYKMVENQTTINFADRKDFLDNYLTLP